MFIKQWSFLINAFAEAIRRAPLTVEVCGEVDIATLANSEFAYLSDILCLLFPDGVVCDKLYEDKAIAN